MNTPTRFLKVSAAGQLALVDDGDWSAVLEPARGLMWTAADLTEDDATFAEAEAAIQALNAQAFCGHTDWRLPTVDELFGLADRSRYSPAIDTAFFPSCASDWYWTSTPYAPSPSVYAWIVRFRYGYSAYGNRGHHFRVRAVRGVPRQ